LCDFYLPDQAWITDDKTNNNYDLKDAMIKAGLGMSPMRKENSKRPIKPWIFYLQSTYQKIVETTGCLIERLLPKSIHSVTAKGFDLKVSLFGLTASLIFLW
jgi:hypothetical protein